MLRELLEFAWDGRSIARSAVIDPPELAALFGDGKQPYPRINQMHTRAESGPGPRVSWTDTYREAVGVEYLQDLLDALGKLGAADDVRLIFSFDS
jgi:hypothetical protein